MQLCAWLVCRFLAALCERCSSCQQPLVTYDNFWLLLAFFLEIMVGFRYFWGLMAVNFGRDSVEVCKESVESQFNQ